MADTEFDTFARDDRINRARWLSGLMFETSTDRLKAFTEVLDLLEQVSDAETSIHIENPRTGEYMQGVARVIDDLAREARSSGPHLHFEVPRWNGATVVVDDERDYWDLQPDGRYKERLGGVVMSAHHLESRYGPVKPIAWPMGRAS